MDKDKFLKEQKVLRLATVGRDETPHIVPVWYRFTSNLFHIGTNTRTKKVHNIMKNPNVCLLIDVGINSPDINGVMITGYAEIITQKKIVEKIAKEILNRYYNSLENEAAQKLLKDTDCIIQVSERASSSWSY